MKKVKIIRTILVILIFLWAYLVFIFSSQQGSDSSGLSRKIVEFFVSDPTQIELIEPYIRKLAHFSEYGLGGTLFISLFFTYDWTDRKKMIISILLGIWYASLDEIHQLMVPDRVGSIFDVYLDTLGFSTGVCSMMILFKIAEIVNKKKSTNNVTINK